ncbi:ATP citrate synthase, beta chain [hydrothermal vent metagenome]|uniref:ATP citrate synthase n=1 Tax=hydrothermal vent metagenome TaxID=652676 RepID=A0A3B1C8S6_9ZZZZ
MGGPAGVSAAKRMAEFCYLTGQEMQVTSFVFPPSAGKTAEVSYGARFLSIPIYKSLDEAVVNHPETNTCLVYIAPNRCFAATMEALNNDNIKFISMITEGVPEKDAKLIIKHANKVGKLVNGPSSIGVFSAGQCRLGVIGGEYNNLKLSKLFRPGSFGVITKSGGLSNEIMWLASQFADGVTTTIGIGGDSYPCTDFVTYLEEFEKDMDTKAVVLVGEMGGNLEEQAAEWYKAKPRRIKLIAVVSGFCQEELPKGMKFGHAGAKEGQHGEGSARSKTDALKAAGVTVPPTFGDLGPTIKQVYEDLKSAGQIKDIEEIPLSEIPDLPIKVEEALTAGDVQVQPLFKTTIVDDRGEEPLYNGYPASELIQNGYDITHVIGLLWNKKLISDKEAEVIKRILMLAADHGPNVSGAFATILAACAGIGMSQSVAAGQIMIGPRFGGAVTDAAKYFHFGLNNYPNDIPGFLAHMKKNVGPVPGIGHRVKSLRNPDKRVEELKNTVKELELRTPTLDYALAVEAVTTAKKDNLILNVDGCIACVLTDLGFPNESLNGFFILARTIGMIGHWIDQKREGSRLIRMYNYLVNFAVPRRRKVPKRK